MKELGIGKCETCDSDVHIQRSDVTGSVYYTPIQFGHQLRALGEAIEAYRYALEAGEPESNPAKWEARGEYLETLVTAALRYESGAQQAA